MTVKSVVTDVTALTVISIQRLDLDEIRKHGDLAVYSKEPLSLEDEVILRYEQAYLIAVVVQILGKGAKKGQSSVTHLVQMKRSCAVGEVENLSGWCEPSPEFDDGQAWKEGRWRAGLWY